MHAGLLPAVASPHGLMALHQSGSAPGPQVITAPCQGPSISAGTASMSAVAAATDKADTDIGIQDMM